MPLSEVLVFDTCCRCTSLRVGCFIIGYCLLAFYAPALVILALMILLHLLQLSAFHYPEDGSFWIFMTIPLIFFAAELAFAIVLLVGLHKRRRGYLLVFLIGIGIVFVLSLLTLVGTITSSPNPGQIICRFIFLAFDIVSFIFVRSYYYKMEEEDVNTDDAT